MEAEVWPFSKSHKLVTIYRT